VREDSVQREVLNVGIDEVKEEMGGVREEGMGGRAEQRWRR
jgi:hypothetical protein